MGYNRQLQTSRDRRKKKKTKGQPGKEKVPERKRYRGNKALERQEADEGEIELKKGSENRMGYVGWLDDSA